MKTSRKFSIPEKQFANNAAYMLWDLRREDSYDAERR